MKKTITKADIVEHLHAQLGLNKSESKKLIEDFFDEIKKTFRK
jgi:Bacterial DNA-binding protein.